MNIANMCNTSMTFLSCWACIVELLNLNARKYKKSVAATTCSRHQVTKYTSYIFLQGEPIKTAALATVSREGIAYFTTCDTFKVRWHL